MWKPKNSPISVEDFNVDDILPDITGQQIKGGSLRLIPSLSGERNYYSNWPLSPTWDLGIDFAYSGHAYSSFTGTTGTLNNWINSEGSWVISNNSGQSGSIYLSDLTPYSLSGFSNDFTLEISLTAESSSGVLQSETGIQGLGLYIRTTGTHEYFEFHSSGVFAQYNSDYNFPLDLRTRKTIRLGLSGNDFYVFAEPTFSLYKLNSYTTVPSTTGSPLISLGTPIGSSISGDLSNFSGTLQIDEFRFYSGFFDLDRPYTQNLVYDTTRTFTYYTDSYKPNFAVEYWSLLQVIHDGDQLPSIETTTITPQYKNSNQDWTDYSSLATTLTSTTPENITLNTVPVLSDGSDQIRFKIEQSTATENIAPPAVDKLILSCVSLGTNLDIQPNWGSYKGGTLVYLKIDADDYSIFPNAVSGQYDSLLISNARITGAFFDEVGIPGNVLTGDLGSTTGIYKFGTGISEISIINSSFSEPYLPAGPLTTDSGASYLSGNPSGIAFGIYGEIATGDYSLVTGNAVDYSDLYLFKDTNYNSDGFINYVQGIYTNQSGIGISIDLTGLTSNQLYKLSSTVKLEKGDLYYCVHQNNYHLIDYENYKEFNEFSTLFTSTGSSDSVRFLSYSTGESIFLLDSISLFSYDFCRLSISGLNHTEHSFSGKGKQQLLVDSKLKLQAAPEEHGYIIDDRDTGNAKGYYLRINQDRKPEFYISLNKTYFLNITGAATTGLFEEVFLTGNYNLPINKDFHLSAGISHSYYSGDVEGARIFIGYNGQIIGAREYDSLLDLSGSQSKDVPILNASTLSGSIGTGLAAEVDWIRVSSNPAVDLEDVGHKKAGFGKPYFESDKWYKPSYQESIVLRSYNEDGALVSDSASRNPFIVLNPDGWITYSNVGAYGRINNFDSSYKGTCYTKIDSPLKNTIQENSGAFSFGSWVTWGGDSGVLFSIGDLVKEESNSYFNIGFKKPNYPFIQTKDNGTEYYLDFSGILPSEESTLGALALEISPSNHFHFGFTLFDSNYYLYYDGDLVHSGAFTLGNPLTGASGFSSLYFTLASDSAYRSFLTCSLEETFLDTNFSGYTGENGFSLIGNSSKSKSTSIDKVFVDSTQLTGGQVVHYTYEDKYIVMPSGSGIATISSASNKYIYDEQTGFQGWKLYADRPYKYIVDYNYEFSFSGIEKYFGGAKSPFKILSSVPEDSVNLAFISQPSFSTNSSLGLIDLSYETLENISNYLFGDFMISSPITGNGDAVYSGSLDTKDFTIGSTSVVREDLSSPEPLFYAYLLGRGKYAVRSSEQTLESLRKSISIIDDNGNPLAQEDFPWDIVGTGVGPVGALSSGDYSVCVLTKYPYISDNTVWAVFNAVPYYSGNIVYGKKEIIFPEPIFEENKDYSISFKSGIWDLTISGVL